MFDFPCRGFPANLYVCMTTVSGCFGVGFTIRSCLSVRKPGTVSVTPPFPPMLSNVRQPTLFEHHPFAKMKNLVPKTVSQLSHAICYPSSPGMAVPDADFFCCCAHALPHAPETGLLHEFGDHCSCACPTGGPIGARWQQLWLYRT